MRKQRLAAAARLSQNGGLKIVVKKPGISYRVRISYLFVMNEILQCCQMHAQKGPIAFSWEARNNHVIISRKRINYLRRLVSDEEHFASEPTLVR